jgi:hypothetical protein
MAEEPGRGKGTAAADGLLLPEHQQPQQLLSSNASTQHAQSALLHPHHAPALTAHDQQADTPVL